MAICVFVVILALSVATADISVSDYVHWKKADISAYHEYFPSRALQEESLTNMYAQYAAQDVARGLEESLRSVARYQAQELATAQLMMEGTSAQGCVEGQGMSTYIDSAIQREISDYEDCAADVESRLSRARTNWDKIYQYYWSVYQRALAGIDTCAKTYPNNDSLSRLKSCVESWNSKYFTVANTTKKYNSLVSPSMSIFFTAAECAQTAAKNVVDKGWQFLQKLVYCSKLSENIDEQEYEEQLKTGFTRYLTRNDLTAQILQAQVLNRQQVSQVEEKMLFYYDLQRKALENYVIESRGLGYYYSQVNDSLSGFYNTIDQISIDYPSNVECISMAKSALSSIVTAGSEIALACDQEIVANTQYLLSTVNSQFLSGNYLLPHTGNVAILQCFSQGYIFAEDTIMGCFNVTSSLFSVEYKEALDRVVKDVDTLLSYQDNFFGNSSLPCSDSVLKRVYWGAEQVLFNLGRCVYIDSGSEYPTNITETGSLTVQERRSWKKIFRDVAKNVAIGYVINSIG